ncbi:OmpA family protein [Croceiramulus getboli]|nr:OmpA family protein [Flavobacteriaceae bacterium YJPT1-3]
MKTINKIAFVGSLVLLTSCVSKKKYVELQTELDQTEAQLTKTQVEKEEIEDKYNRIEERVAEYNAKINSLKTENESKFVLVDNGTVMSDRTREGMKSTLAKVNSSELAEAKTLEDSMNLALSYNLKQSLDQSFEGSSQDDIDINIDETVVMITISDQLLFDSGSYRVSKKADDLLSRIASVINSEPTLEVLVEGHTDARTVKEGSYIKDNWDLSTERASAIIRKLQDDFSVDPGKMIAAGRSSYHPLVENDTKENMARNRRTRIVILPNMDKFLALLTADN